MAQTIAEGLNLLISNKAAIKQAIIDLGVAVSDSDAFSTYANKIASISGSSSSSRDWTAIGYSAEPDYIEEGYNYAVELYNSLTTVRNNQFSNDADLIFLPLVDTSNLTSMSSFCYKCLHLIYVPLLNTSNVTNMGNAFSYCYSLKEISALDTSKVTNLSSTFYACYSLESIPTLDTSKVTTMSSTFGSCSSLSSLPTLDYSSLTSATQTFSGCTSLKSIDMSSTTACKTFNRTFYSCTTLHTATMDFGAATTMHQYTFYNTPSLRNLTIYNLGKSSLTAYNFTYPQYWGIATTTYPDARQTLVDSLLTYSYDRVNGVDYEGNSGTVYSTTCTITLSSNVKNQLTDDEIAQITAKGYTIA